MSETVAKERSDADFDEFERHYRQHDYQTGGHAGEDPLAELARLVGEHPDPYGDVFTDRQLAQEAAHYQAYEHRHEPTFAGGTGLSPRLSGDFATIEAGLRGALPSHGDAYHQPQQDHDGYAAHDPQLDHSYSLEQTHSVDHAYAEDQAYAQDHEPQQWAIGDMAQEKPAEHSGARSRRPVYAIIATIAIGVIGVGAAFAFKGSSSSPSEIKTIAAASGPTKVQPPADAASSDQTGQDSAMLNKGQQTAPNQLVSREEQPVDVSQAVQENASHDADAGAAPGDASSVPVPPSPTQAHEASAGATPDNPSASDPIGSFGMSGMPAPKKVKVVSVKPDGTILPNDKPPVAALTASHSRSGDKGTPVAKASTPKSGSTPKTTSRASSKPTKVASADVNDDDAAPAPKPAKKAKAKPQHVASAETTDDSQTATAAAPAKTGSFAVQLAAPSSEADARSAAARLGKKYAETLGGRKLGFHKAESNGKSVYRVRVGSLSKDEATSLCEKLKSDGGSCFVAKN